MEQIVFYGSTAEKKLFDLPLHMTSVFRIEGFGDVSVTRVANGFIYHFPATQEFGEVQRVFAPLTTWQSSAI